MENKKKSGLSFTKFLIQNNTYIIFAILFIVCCVLSSNFLTIMNLKNIALQQAAPILVALGMLFVVVTGGIDLSVGSVMAFGASFTAILIKNMNVPFLLAILAAMVLSMAMGCFTGVLVAYAKMQGFVASLAMMTIARGVAEYALLLIMALRRKLLSGNRGVREGDWTKEIGNETVGSTVGILGFGAVGKTFAKLLQGFGCRVLAYDTWQDQKAAEELGVEFVDAETVFRESDAITVHLAFNDDTHFFVNKERLSLMKPDNSGYVMRLYVTSVGRARGYSA